MKATKKLFAIALMLTLVLGSSMAVYAQAPMLETSAYQNRGEVTGVVEEDGDLYRAFLTVDVTNVGSRFIRWQQMVDSDWIHLSYEPEFEFVMEGDTVVRAYFEPVFNLTVSVNDPLMGDYSIVGYNGLEHYGYPGPGEYIGDEEIYITPIVMAGYRLVNWTYAIADDERITSDPNEPIEFLMPEADLDIEINFAPSEGFMVMGDGYPVESGTIEGTGVYTEGSEVTLMAMPDIGYNFVEWDFDPEVIMPTISEDEMTFMMPEWDVDVTAVFEEASSVLATIKYVNTSAVSIQPDTQVLLFNGPYTQNAPAISGYQHIYSSPNRVGTVVEGDGDFVITHVYQVPPTPQVITNTVTETVFVNVPATTAPTTAPATTEVITTEAVPLGAPGPFNFDEFVEDETLPATETMTDPEEVMEEEVPLADGLPATGLLSADYFYGIGGLISGLGLWLKRRK